MKIKAIPAAQLTPEQLSCWSLLQRGNPELESPYFCPQFTQAVAAVRPDVQVAILEDRGEMVGFFPFQRSRLGIGSPVGGALSDFQGVIVARGVQWDVPGLFRDCRLVAWEFGHLLASQRPFRPYHSTTMESHFIDLSDGFDGYAERLRRSGSHLLKDVRAKRRKLEQRYGRVRFVPHTDKPEVLDLLLSWKAKQYQRSGLLDVFSFVWTVELVRRIHATQTGRFAGMLSALYVDDDVAAVHMGMRSASTWHWWFPRHNERYAKYSPGILLRVLAAEAAPRFGICRLDLGCGDETTYKPRLSTGSVALASGRVELPSTVTRIHQLYRGAEAWIRHSPLLPVARVPGRLVKRVERRLRFR